MAIEARVKATPAAAKRVAEVIVEESH